MTDNATCLKDPLSDPYAPAHWQSESAIVGSPAADLETVKEEPRENGVTGPVLPGIKTEVSTESGTPLAKSPQPRTPSAAALSPRPPRPADGLSPRAIPRSPRGQTLPKTPREAGVPSRLSNISHASSDTQQEPLPPLTPRTPNGATGGSPTGTPTLSPKASQSPVLEPLQDSADLPAPGAPPQPPLYSTFFPAAFHTSDWVPKSSNLIP